MKRIVRQGEGRKYRPWIVVLSLTLTASTAATEMAAPPDAKPRLGINLAGPADWMTELPFVDAFRTARPWIRQKTGAGWGQGPELAIDDFGWVKRLEPGCYAEAMLCTISGGRYPGGTYMRYSIDRGKTADLGAQMKDWTLGHDPAGAVIPTPGIRYDGWKAVYLENRAKQLQVWREPFVPLRLPLLFNLRRDPFERAQENSNTYHAWKPFLQGTR